MNELQKLMDDVAEWSDVAFGDGQRSIPIAHHLRKEVNELIASLTRKRDNKPLGTYDVEIELADCFMLLIDCASHEGINAQVLIDLTRLKLDVNKKRKWGVPDENGVIEHIKEGQP